MNIALPRNGTTPHRLLVVAAHPDDEVLGAGGLIHRTTASGGEARILILSEGSSTQYPGDTSTAQQKLRESVLAARILGVDIMKNAGLPDMALALEAPSALTAPIVDSIQAWQPDWVATHSPNDLNSDHRAAHEATRVACRALLGEGVKLLCYEVPSASEYGYRPFEPTLFVRLDRSDLDAKMQALAAYCSETRAWPHGRSQEALEVLARTRGFQCRSDAAEAYTTVWEVL